MAKSRWRPPRRMGTTHRPTRSWWKAQCAPIRRWRMDCSTGATRRFGGAARQAVEVSAAVSVVQPTSSEVQTSIDSRSMRELPLNGRNPLQLVTLTAGAIDAGGGGNFQAANGQVAVNGNRGTDNTFEID